MSRKHYFHTASVLLLILIFCLCISLVILSGVTSYKRISENTQDNFNDRTCLSYINTKIKHYDSSENVITVSSLNGNTALKISEKIENAEYDTWIYYYEGYLYELFTEANNSPDPESGQNIASINSLDFQQVSPNLIKVSCSSKKNTLSEIYISLRSISEVATNE